MWTRGHRADRHDQQRSQIATQDAARRIRARRRDRRLLRRAKSRRVEPAVGGDDRVAVHRRRAAGRTENERQ